MIGLIERARRALFSVNWQRLKTVAYSEPEMTGLVSQLVTQKQMESEAYKRWCAEIQQTPRYHRKLWEYVYVLQALYENNLLRTGTKGIGFGVGKEPLPAVMAKYGCTVVVTDLELDAAKEKGWRDTEQHSNSLEELNGSGICEMNQFRQLVSFQNVDMNNMGPDLQTGSFDFAWSCCALEHLGSIELGLKFIKESLKCLKPNGLAIHTTEYNLSSNNETLETGDTVLFRRKDIESLIDELREEGHQIKFNPHAGDGYIDKYYDIPPYRGDHHLKLLITKYVSTSIGVIITKSDKVL